MMSSWMERYTTPLSDIFAPKNFLRLQLAIEKALAQANAACGLIPQEAADEISKACTTETVTLQRVRAIEKEIHHEPMNIVMGISEQCPTYGGYVHFGATSNDIMDTMWGLLLRDSRIAVLTSLDQLEHSLIKFIEQYGSITVIGRTHGQHAIPTTLGFKFANFLSELHYARANLLQAKVDFGKMSGAIGTYASFRTMDVEQHVMQQLGLQPARITTQVVPRILHASFMFALAGIASTVERLAKEIRHSQRSEIGELQEPFTKHQVGSSTMPQKRNPHKTERICGIARIIRANVQASMENIPLEHERDISNSSVERVILPESIILTHYIILQMQQIIDQLVVHQDRITQNLHMAGGRQLAERLMLHLTDTVGRQQAHEILKGLADAEDFEAAVLNHPVLGTHFTQQQLEEMLDPNTYIGLAVQKTQQVVSSITDELSAPY